MLVIVVGMHRSGTSALAGLLHSNGVTMGEDVDFYPPPMRENPKGFFENKRFRQLNDKLLHDGGHRVKAFKPITPAWNEDKIKETYLDRMVHLIKYYDNYFQLWGWKDPRTCLTLKFWIDAIALAGIDSRQVKVIVMLRKYTDVAQSMRNRGNKERLYTGQFSDLARLYHNQALETLIGNNIPYVNVSFEHLLYETHRAVDHINTYLGGNIIKDVSFIDAKISRTKRQIA